MFKTLLSSKAFKRILSSVGFSSGIVSSGGGGANPFADSPRTFVQSPQQCIFDQAGTSILFASNGTGGALKMVVGNAAVYPNSATGFFKYTWNGSAWVYSAFITQGTNQNVTSFSYSTIDILDFANAVYFAANYTP